MPFIEYEPWNPSAGSALVVQRANAICADFQARGYSLTLRQVYYQFVSRGWIPNKQSEYDRLGELLSKARLGGHMDWNYLEDRTRNLRSNAHWADPGDIINSAAASYRLDHWAGQPVTTEVWVEKDALVGVLETVCGGEDVAYFSCRGYTSQSELWAAAQRLIRKMEAGPSVVVYHLGDHDPSGLQMTEDIMRRLRMFISTDAPQHRRRYQVVRIALNMDQIQQYNPPPNPAKTTDSRYAWYINKFGTTDSWELDALDPDVIAGLVRNAVQQTRRDSVAYQGVLAKERSDKELLRLAYKNWAATATWLATTYGNGANGATTAGQGPDSPETTAWAPSTGQWAYDRASGLRHLLGVELDPATRDTECGDGVAVEDLRQATDADPACSRCLGEDDGPEYDEEDEELDED